MDIVDQYHKSADNSKEQDLFIIRKACVKDVKEILELINGFAQLNLMLPRGPRYLYENIRNFVIAVSKNAPSAGKAMLKGTRPKGAVYLLMLRGKPELEAFYKDAQVSLFINVVHFSADIVAVPSYSIEGNMQKLSYLFTWKSVFYHIEDIDLSPG